MPAYNILVFFLNLVEKHPPS